MFKYMYLDLYIGLVFNVTSWVMHVEHNTSSTFLCFFFQGLCVTLITQVTIVTVTIMLTLVHKVLVCICKHSCEVSIIIVQF